MEGGKENWKGGWEERRGDGRVGGMERVDEREGEEGKGFRNNNLETVIFKKSIN